MKTSDEVLVRSLFLRTLGVIYFIAFVSLWSQLPGLIGSRGILPAAEYISAVQQYAEANGIGLDRYRLIPTFAWISASDQALIWQAAVGAAFGAALAAGLAPRLCLVLSWLLYLSLTTAGQDFLGFQWDNLLLETGLLAIFFAPSTWLLRSATDPPPSRVAVWLLRWLLFRLMFESGAVKLLSGDPSWRQLTALAVHYETQPLPTWIGWLAHQLPLWCQKASCAAMFCIELGAPFVILGPRRLRLIGCALLTGLQVLILLTGNYTFFNWLTIALCLLLLDDRALTAILPPFIRTRLRGGSMPSETRRQPPWRTAAGLCGAALVVVLSVARLAGMFGVGSALLPPVEAAENWIAPFRSINSYGLFAVMTTSRPEISVEGSNDGVEWRAYAFKYKPGDVRKRPGFVAPFQPRLDWQMWFAALSTWRNNRWFTSFCARLLDGSPSVLALLATNPFPDHPPRYVRAMLYDYRFTNLTERRATGAWWKQTPAGEYMPAVSLTR